MKKLTLGTYLLSRLYVYGLILCFIVPMLYIVSSSLTNPNPATKMLMFFIPRESTLQNYASAVRFAADTLHITIWRLFLNSMIYTFAAIGLGLVLATTAAFGFSNYEFKGKEALFVLMLATMTIPVQSLIIPLFLMMKRFSLLNSYLALVLPYTAIGLPFSTLLLRGFFQALPKEIRDAAQMDGATDFGYFRRVVLPLSTAPLATCVIFLFLTYWNEFLIALVMIQSDEMSTLTLALSKIVQGRVPQPVPVYSAIIVIGAIPILIVFILFQKWFVRGVAAGAVKG